MMAAAEARAAWQRTANRCFVQEDAKRAPRLACCPSTTPSKQVDTGPENTAEGHDNPNVGFVPPNGLPSHSNLSPESRWWLQMQPNYGYQKLPGEQLNSTLEAEMEVLASDFRKPTSKPGEGNPQYNDDFKQELKSVSSDGVQEPLKHTKMDESYELLGMDPVGCSFSKQANELGFDSDSSWIGAERIEPWWRVTDRDELASLVAERSLDLIENCDLPRPQKVHVKDFDSSPILPASKDLKSQADRLYSSGLSPILGRAGEEHWASFEEQLQYHADNRKSDGPTYKGATETPNFDADHSKAQLLEALRHSQTRAREAEKAAKQAYAEKEHILKLFFRQASHLFAYKQWFQLLQLENLYFQIKNNHQPISTLFPVVLPWMPHKASKQKKQKPPSKGKRSKPRRPSNDYSKFSLAVALGLGLVGAGLLLGWTVGWMWPGF